MTTPLFISDYTKYVVSDLVGRYLPYETLKKFTAHYQPTVCGISVLEQPIELIQVGNGSKKVLMWSQMHGNESTTTKAVIDMLSFLTRSSSSILDCCTLYILPMLNPDGVINGNYRCSLAGCDLNH